MSHHRTRTAASPGSIQPGSVLLGSIRLGSERLGSERLGAACLAAARLGAVCLSAVCMAVPAAAQDDGTDLSGYIRGFREADIRDLTSIVHDMSSQVNDLSGSVRDMVADSGGDIAMRETDGSIVLSVTSDVLFAFDSAELTAPARETLARIAAVLTEGEGGASQGAVQVVGHTDSKGPEDYNQRLSEDRAASVVAFLTESGVPSDRLRAAGRGESEPVAPNQIDGADDPEGRAQNRRVEFVLPR